MPATITLNCVDCGATLEYEPWQKPAEPCCAGCVSARYHIDAAAIYGCPRCGSDDLGFTGANERRTHEDITDVIACEECDYQWIRPGSENL